MTCLPERAREALALAAKGNRLVPADHLDVVRSMPHGHVAAVLGLQGGGRHLPPFPAFPAFPRMTEARLPN